MQERNLRCYFKRFFCSATFISLLRPLAGCMIHLAEPAAGGTLPLPYAKTAEDAGLSPRAGVRELSSFAKYIKGPLSVGGRGKLHFPWQCGRIGEETLKIGR